MELKQDIRDALEKTLIKNYKHVNVSIVDCPDLTQGDYYYQLAKAAYLIIFEAYKKFQHFYTKIASFIDNGLKGTIVFQF